MIGYWNYTVVLTYMSLASAVGGMVFAFDGRILSALTCLAVSGLCDAFDGRVARSKKNRTESEKLFGIQLDSLCDVVGFGFLPGLICYKLGLQSPVGIALIIFYCVASVARLAYYNTLELEKDGSKPLENCYYGLPITSIVVIFPVTYYIAFLLPARFETLIWELMLLITGGLFISNIRFPKPGIRQILLISLGVAALFLAMPFLVYMA